MGKISYAQSLNNDTWLATERRRVCLRVLNLLNGEDLSAEEAQNLLHTMMPSPTPEQLQLLEKYEISAKEIPAYAQAAYELCSQDKKKIESVLSSYKE